MKSKYQESYQYEQAVVHVYGQAAIGAAGAPTLSPKYAKGITSIARTGAGAYDIVFDEKFIGLLDANMFQVAAAAEELSFQIEAVSLATKTISIFSKAAAVATDPSNGSTLFFKFSFKNSSV